MEKAKLASRLGAAVALVLAGVLMGSIMLTPVGAHITTFKHLKTKHFFTKKAANARFIDTAEAGETKVVVDTTATLETTSSTSFVDVPGAVTSLTVPAGHTAMILARFSAESACYGADQQNCGVRILIGGTEASPAVVGDFAFDTNRAGDNPGTMLTGEAHSMERYRPDLTPGTYEVKVQFLSVSPNNTTQLDDWILTVERITTG